MKKKRISYKIVQKDEKREREKKRILYNKRGRKRILYIKRELYNQAKFKLLL